MPRRTGYFTHDAFLRHLTGPMHPERPPRLQAIHRRLEQSGLLQQLLTPQFDPAPDQALLLAHDADYLDRLQTACQTGQTSIDCGDSAICPESADIARLAAGAVLAACDQVLAGTLDNAFCAVRPPGHHAEVDRSMGFCLYANVAIAACHLRQNRRLDRIAILDFDVHHGNGTQHVLDARQSGVLFCSIHEDPRFLYPHNSGFARETGNAHARGSILNLPMPPGSSDAQWQAALTQHFFPAARAFDPQFILVSAGFDAHHDDPLAHCELSTSFYTWVTRQLIALASQTAADGRIVSVLEGGYNLEALADGVETHLATLLDNREEFHAMMKAGLA